jgi:hypothetical protein
MMRFFPNMIVFDPDIILIEDHSDTKVMNAYTTLLIIMLIYGICLDIPFYISKLWFLYKKKTGISGNTYM